MAGNSCLYRCTIHGDVESNVVRFATGSSGATVPDKIEFNGGVVPDSRGHLRSSFADMETAIAENDKPFAQINELQDTKISRITFTIVGVIDNPSVNNIAQTFKVWEIEDKINTVFTKGRFGLRVDDFPAFNLTPSDSGTPRGYLIGNVHLEKDVELNRLSFTCPVRFNGDPGVNPYNW